MQNIHIIFATDTITSAAEHKQLKEQLSKYFPFVDPNAVDASRFFFGTEAPDVEYHAGTMSLNTFLVENDDSWCRDFEEIPEGQRNQLWKTDCKARRLYSTGNLQL